MQLTIDSIQQGKGHYLDLYEDEMMDPAKYAIWDHLIVAHISDSRHGIPDSLKSRNILIAIAQVHNVELLFLHNEPMNKIKKQQVKQRRAEFN